MTNDSGRNFNLDGRTFSLGPDSLSTETRLKYFTFRELNNQLRNEWWGLIFGETDCNIAAKA